MNIDKDIKEFVETFSPTEELEVFSKEELEILFQYQRNQTNEFKDFINPLPFIVNFETAIDFLQTNEGKEFWISKYEKNPIPIESLSFLQNFTNQKENVIDIYQKTNDSILFSIEDTYYKFHLNDKTISRFPTIDNAKNGENSSIVENESFTNIINKTFSSSSIIKMTEFSKNNENPNISSINVLINKEINNLLKYHISSSSPDDTQYRQIFDDNLFDIHSIKDFNLNKLDFDILSKDDKSVSFEFGGDFWIYNTITKTITQYPDFVSMRDKSTNGKIVFNEYDDSQSNEYGEIIHKGIINGGVLEIENFNLEKRTNYFLDNTIKGIKKNIDYSQGLKLQQKTEHIGKKALDLLPKTNELQPIKDFISSAISLLSLFLILSKRKRIDIEKEATIEKIIRALENKEIKFEDILNDNKLLKEIPELKNILEKHQENKAFKISGNELRIEIENIINNDYIINIADKLSENETFKQEVGKKIFNAILETLSKNYNKNIVEELKKAFSQSPYNDIDEFVSANINANLSTFYQLNKDLTGEQYAIAGIFITSCINQEDKTTLSEIANIEKLTHKDFSNIGKIINTILTQTLKKEEKQGLKI